MKKIVCVISDRVSIISPNYKAFPDTLEGQAAALSLAQAGLPLDASFRVVDESEIPADRTFRDALKPDLTVDLQKAKVLAKQRTNDPRVDTAVTIADLKAALEPVKK